MSDKEVKLEITAQSKDAEDALRNVTKELNKTGEAAQKAAEQTAKASATITDKLAKIGKAAAAVNVAIAGVGAAMLHTAVDWVNACNDMSDATGMTAKKSAELLTVAAHVGVATGEMAQAMAIMDRNAMAALQAQQVAAVEGKKSADVFTQFGIAITDNNGKLLSAEQIFDNVAAKHRAMADGVAKTSMEMQIFGRSGTKFNDMLNLSAEKVTELKKKAGDLGLTVSDDVAMKFRLAQRSVNDTQLAFKSIAVRVGADLAPTVKSAADKVAELANKYAQLDDITRQNIGNVVKAAAETSALATAIGLVTKAATILAAHPVVATLIAIGSAAKYTYDQISGFNQSIEDGKKYGINREDFKIAHTVSVVDYDDFGNETIKQEIVYTYDQTAYEKAIAQAKLAEQARADAAKAADAQIMQSDNVVTNSKVANIETKKQAAQEQANLETELATITQGYYEALRATDIEQYLAWLESKDAMRMLDIQNEMAERQMLWDWVTQANADYNLMWMQIADQTKNALGQGIADVILNGKDAVSVIRNIGSQAIAMLIQFMTQKAAASLLTQSLAKKEAKVNAQNAAAQGQALVNPAVQQSIAMLGPVAAIPAYSAAVTAMTALGQGVGAIGSISLANPTGHANGGVASGLSIVGERGPELIDVGRPSRVYTARETAGLLANRYSTADDNGVRNTQNNTINLNVSAVDAQSFAGLLASGGLDAVKQALFEDDRGFGSTSGVW